MQQQQQQQEQQTPGQSDSGGGWGAETEGWGTAGTAADDPFAGIGSNAPIPEQVIVN